MARISSSSQHTFAQIPKADIPRSSFRRNSNYKTTLNAGYLVPVFLDEVLPGDTFNLKITSFARILAPLKYPILDNLYMDYQFFFVPTRLVYADYEKFFGSSKGLEGNWEYDDSHLMPAVNSGEEGFAIGSIADYFGIPTGVPNLKVNSLPFRAYNLIVSDWYLPSSYGLDSPKVLTDYNRDENGNAIDDDASDFVLRKRLKRADAFTAALPEPQRGPGVNLPIGGTAPVIGIGTSMGLNYGGDDVGMIAGFHDGVSSLCFGADALYQMDGTTVSRPTFSGLKAVGLSMNAASSGVVADLTRTSAASINSIRQAFQLQRWLERDELGGVRYVSTLLNHFGVRSPDARLQRSEYLGGGSTPIQIHSVANTAGGDTAQATLSAFGLSATQNVGFVKSFVEHGYVIGLVSVRSDNTYQQGLPKMFDRFARFDFYWPVFAHLGEEVVKNRQIYAQGNDVLDDFGIIADERPFGYQERYYDYRYGVSKITGELRSTAPLPLDSWHLAQKFNNLPQLNQEFLEVDVPMNRVKAVTDGPDFLYDSLISLNCVRPMPLFGVPGLVDHF